MFRDISLLESTSILAVFIIGSFVIIISVLGIRRWSMGVIQWSDIRFFNFAPKDLFAATPTVSLAYTCQTSVFPIWKELENPRKSRMNLVQIIATCIAFTLYAVAGVFGYILQPEDTPGNFLEGLPDKQIFYLVVKLVFAVAIMFHYPVVHYAFRNSHRDCYYSGCDHSDLPGDSKFGENI